MNVKTSIRIQKFKKQLRSNYYKTMQKIFKPLITYTEKRENLKYARTKAYIINMSDEELIERFSKYLLKDMVRRSDTKKTYDICNKYTNNYDFEESIIYELGNLTYDCKDPYLKNARYYKKLSIYDEEFIEKERQFIEMLRTQLEKQGIKAYYENLSDNRDEFYIKYAQYEKSLVIDLTGDLSGT